MKGITSTFEPGQRIGAGLACAVLLAAGMAACSGSGPKRPAPDSQATGRISPWLMAAISRVQSGEQPPGMVGHPARVDGKGRLQIEVHVDQVSAAHSASLAAAGLTNPEPVPALDVVQGWAAGPAIYAIARLPFVRRLSLPRYARSR
jgi:hypothetical protein